MKLYAKIRHRCKRVWQDDVIFWQRHKKKIISWTIIIFHVLGIFSSIDAVMHTRTPQGAIAWAVSLNTFPYLAVPAYWVFGSNEMEGYVAARQSARDKGKNIEEQLRARLREEEMVYRADDEVTSALQQLAELPFTNGNSADLLINGNETYESILHGIKNAKDYILFQFYIIRDDKIGKQFLEALTEKARQGVKVYAMYDEIGSFGLPKEFDDPLVKAGGFFIPFNTTQGFGNRFQLNFRNHRKVVVVDGREAWIGGINIGQEYSNSSLGSSVPDDEVYYRDTHLWMTGPVVQMVQAVFMEDWYWAARNFPRLNWDPERATTGSLKMLCLPSGPSDELETCALFFLTAINNATERIWISTPYFVPDAQIISALTLAVLRGVDVRIMVPEETDSKLIDLSHRGIIGAMEKTGVKIYNYEKGFNHQKVMLVDDRFSYVGTANLDNRSFRLNFEITMVVDDEGFAGKTEEMLNKDFADSRLVKVDEFSKASFLGKLLSRTALLLSPIQ